MSNTLKTITCLECHKPNKEEDNTIKEHENCWWLCEECENEVEAKLDCFNNDVNYNLSTY